MKIGWVALAVVGVGLAGCAKTAVVMEETRGGKVEASSPVTDIRVGTGVKQAGMKRFGINLGSQTFYDSGQMMRNLAFQNPGFEGETWQSILRCAGVTATSCIDDNQWTQWPSHFLDGATFEFISGQAEGVTGTVETMDAANPKMQNQGVTIRFAALSRLPAIGDFVLVKKTIPGNAQAGWWTTSSADQVLSTEFQDLAPHTEGKQALKIMTAGADQWASVGSYFDSMAGHSFVQMKGPYRIAFKAKSLAGNGQVKVVMARQVPGHPGTMVSRVVDLARVWKEYNVDFMAGESGSMVGTLALSFNVAGEDMLLDDVSLESTAVAPWNKTAYRDEVVATLKELRPGVLRYQDGDHLGSSIDNLITPVFGRMRAGFSEGGKQQNMVPTGLEEFLELCKAVGAEPWFNMPAGISPAETKELIEFLAGGAGTPYGAKRAALGQAQPWTTVFPVIHLELGNEEWNTLTFVGAAMPDPVAYGRRAQEVFTAARTATGYEAGRFDLVIGSFAVIPEMTKTELASSGAYDSAAVAPYLFSRLDDWSSTEAIFGPMLAEPEMFDDAPDGMMVRQAQAAKGAARPANLEVYEENIGTDNGSAPQDVFDRTTPSVGAGIALLDHMLLMARDLGIKVQNVWSLQGFENGFTNSATHAPETTRLYGVVVDMGGATNLRRPQYLAEELANEAVLPTMVETTLTGANPTWHQGVSKNNKIHVDKAHCLQTFAFADGGRHSLIVFNLSRTEALPVTFSGEGAPVGVVDVGVLTSKEITDTNEVTAKVGIRRSVVKGFDGKKAYFAPPFSMTVLRWGK